MRCKACDEIMKEDEIIWIEEFSMHEELCRKCRKSLADDDDDLDPTALGLDIYIGEVDE